MEKKWNGKTKGTLLGYQFFVYSIRFFGIRFSYAFCRLVTFYYVLFASKNRNALIHFYQIGFQFSYLKSFGYTIRTFFNFGQVLIDRIALKTTLKNHYSFTFENEAVLKEINTLGKGGFLFSGHIGNWENAGSFIGERITSKINILMLDAEVEKIKGFLSKQTEAVKFNLIPLKDDMSHLILIHQALKRNEMIALHADRVVEDQKKIRLPFLNGLAEFPLGPFFMAHKFNVPLTFVFALKGKGLHYDLSATNYLINATSPEELALKYVEELESNVKKAPNQWFNFYKYYVS
jgi:predicted LPLAT superfamily acyltransferase